MAMSASQILELSSHPWVLPVHFASLIQAAKRNPRLLTTIPASPEKPKKRRKPSKKERDYKKKIEAEEERKLRNERKYEKYLKYGNQQGGSRGSSDRRGSSGRGRGMRVHSGFAGRRQE